MGGLVAVFDNDDVILKMGEKKILYMRDHFPNQDLIRGIRPYECSRTSLVPIIGRDFYDEMNSVVKGRESTITMAPFEGTAEGIKALAEIYQIHVISARTPEETEYVKERLDMLGLYKHLAGVSSTENPAYNNIAIISGKKKVDVALQLGASALTDDDERHMPDSEIDGLQCYLFGQTDRKNAKPYMTIVRDWKQLVYQHQKMERAIRSKS